MGCCHAKPQSNILNPKRFSSELATKQGTGSPGKIGSGQFEKLRTKCEYNDNPNLDNEHNLEDQNGKFGSKQPISLSKFANDDASNTRQFNGDLPQTTTQCKSEKIVEEVEKSVEISQRQQLLNIMEQEGFGEKINHINKIYNMLLQSQDEGYDHCSFDDPDLNDFLSGLQAISTISPVVAAAKSNLEIRRDTRGETIIDIPSEKIHNNNIANIVNAVLSSDYRLITSPTQSSSFSKQFQFDKQSCAPISAKLQMTIATADIGINSPSSVDHTDTKSQFSKQNQMHSNNPLSPPKTNTIGSNGQQLSSSQTSNQFNQLSFRNMVSNQQNPLHPISEEKKGKKSQEDHCEQEEELKTSKVKDQQHQQLKRETSLKKKVESKEILNRENTDKANTKKVSIIKNLSYGDVLQSTNSTMKTKTVGEKYQKGSLTDLKKSYQQSFYQAHSNNHLALPLDQQAQISLYRHTMNFNDISLQEIELDFKDNSEKPQIQVSSLASKASHSTK